MTESHPEKKIIVIPAKNESPQEQAKKRNLRVAAYCRVSTGDEEQLTSYENQKAFYTEKIMKIRSGQWWISSRMRASRELPPAGVRISCV